jgi:aconitate hydratase
MLAIGAGGLDVALAMAGEPFKLVFPKVVGVRLSGRLAPWVSAKDVILHLLSILSTKGNVGTAVEYFGPGVAALSAPERATIANMGAELGVTASVFPSDDETRAFLRAQAREADWQPLAADADAVYARVIEIDLGTLEPLAACPSSPGNVKSVASLADVEVGQVLVGSCINSSLKDMTLVATMLRGRTVAPGVSLGVAPGSRQVLEMLARDGLLADIIRAGARVLESACGPCIGQGFSPANDTVTVRTFNRNFLNRTGTKNDKCYLVSPETAVATALRGRLTDPRTLGLEYPEWRMPVRFLIDDSMVLRPLPAGTPVAIVRKATIGEPPLCRAVPESLDGEVLVRLGDKITTDHIMPAGEHLKLRSNIPAYSQVVFECLNEKGKPTFAERAAAVRDAGRCGVIVAGESYGQGSSREHAAICPMHLGVRVVLALSIERIHAANLINFGILPLLLPSAADLDLVREGDRIKIRNVREQLKPGCPLDVERCDARGASVVLRCRHALSETDIRMVLAGGRLNARG